jgi:hypothetical protein
MNRDSNRAKQANSVLIFGLLLKAPHLCFNFVEDLAGLNQVFLKVLDHEFLLI